ncbi:MAG: hypothetical protein II799_03095 [Lachnospiraceae bacterium]|nr:hypothetical protein [Lachnospiraceae bacterium]
MACMVVTGEDEEEKEPFRAGVGKICYRMPKEDFLDRVKAFEKDVTDIINSTVKPSYSDFEKCFALYEYMESDYTYDYDWPPDTKDGLVYNCFMTHTGICGELASIYTYLLMECGIDAVTVEDSKMSHAWTLVTLDGQPYHVDPTWGLKDAPEDQLYLNYFMMTNADRIRDDFDPNYWTLTLLADPFLTDYDVDILAEDDRYSCFRGSYLVSADYDADTIEYVDGSETHTLNYR